MLYIYKMADYLYYQTIVESTITIMELIEQRSVDIHLNRLMDEDDTVLFAFHRQMSNETNIYAQTKVRSQPYLNVDLQELFLTFFQILTCEF